MRTKIVCCLLLFVALNALSCMDLKASAGNDTLRKTTDSVSNPAKTEKLAALTPLHRNTIKFNPTPMLLWGEIRNMTFSYERLIKKNQSVSIQLGYLVIPRVFDTIVGVAILSDYQRKGINVAFDYRYYPQFRNRRPAPDGLYLGGYLSYYGFRFTNNIDILPTEAGNDGSLKGSMNMVNLGVELGYQFIFWKRLSVDLLMFGPSLSMYHRKLELTGNLSQADIEKIDEDLAKKLMDRYPVLGYLFGGQTSTFSGSQVRLSTGFRYSIQVGFHF